MTLSGIARRRANPDCLGAESGRHEEKKQSTMEGIMRKTLGTAVALTAMIQASVASAQFTPAPPPMAPPSMPGNALQPTSKWLGNYGDNSCEMVRDFGEATKPMELVVRPLTGADNWQFELRYNGVAPKLTSGSARLGMYTSSSAKSAVGSYVDAALSPDDHFDRAMMFEIPRRQLADLGSAEVITFVYGTRHTSLAPGLLSAVTAELKRCEDDLVESWGYDPKVMNGLKSPPMPISPELWFASKDWPAKESKESGPARIRFTVGADGSVSKCALVATSGSKSFDDKACQTISAKARFKPAIDANGQPVATLYVWEVVRPFGA
jgi:TonB family protein